MKKIILSLLFFTFSYSSSYALSEIEISGEMDVAASMWTLPTGERGVSSFTVPSLFLNLEAPLKDENLLVVKLEGSDEKTGSTERFDVKVREAYVDVVSFFQGMHGVRFGLIPQTWQEAQYETWTYRFLGSTTWVMTEKWKYLSPSDLGFSYMSELSDDLGEWAFSMTNGEGAQEKEVGPHKEGSLFVRLPPWTPVVLSLNYVRGFYEKYSLETGVKERIQAQLTYEVKKDCVLGLEYLRTHDPADAVRDYKMAEEVDVTALSGEAVNGQGASVFAIIGIGAQSDVMLRFDYLNPVMERDAKDLQTAVLAWGYQATEDLKWAFAVDHTHYGADFAAGARDRSKLEIAAQVLF